jgi:hypothetical protein
MVRPTNMTYLRPTKRVPFHYPHLQMETSNKPMAECPLVRTTGGLETEQVGHHDLALEIQKTVRATLSLTTRLFSIQNSTISSSEVSVIAAKTGPKILSLCRLVPQYRSHHLRLPLLVACRTTWGWPGLDFHSNGPLWYLLSYFYTKSSPQLPRRCQSRNG